MHSMDAEEDHPALWDYQAGPGSLRGNSVRGYWVLHFPPNEVEEVWNILTEMVANGNLSYLVSKCKDAMGYGQYRGWFSICCFAVDQERYDVLHILEERGFGIYISDFRLLKQFRMCEDDYF